MTGQDALLLLLVANGEIDAIKFVTYLLGDAGSYVVMGASITIDGISASTPPQVIFDIMIDTSYNNK